VSKDKKDEKKYRVTMTTTLETTSMALIQRDLDAMVFELDWKAKEMLDRGSFVLENTRKRNRHAVTRLEIETVSEEKNG
jgi:hypothetical protein